jgi:hypothetical protein
MAAYVHKTWNAVPSIIPEGVAIKFSTNRFYLYVLDAEGTEIAKFRSQVVRDYWVESPTSLETGGLGGFEHSANRQE